MNIVLIIWKIKKDKEEDFLLYWRGLSIKPEHKAGIFREFLSKVGEEEINTWDITSSGCLTYINVGIWRSSADFKLAIGDYMNSPTQTFEAKRRRRVVLENVKWNRAGTFELPPPDF